MENWDTRSEAYKVWHNMGWDAKLAFADSLGVWDKAKKVGLTRLEDDAQRFYEEDGAIYGIGSSDQNHAAMGVLASIFVNNYVQAHTSLDTELDNCSRFR